MCRGREGHTTGQTIRMEIELVGGAADGVRATVGGDPAAPCPYVLVAEHLPLRTEDAGPTSVEALLASFRVVRYERDNRPRTGGGSRRIYRRDARSR